MNELNNRIETYLNENEVLGRITELRSRGLPEDNIFVFSDDSEDSSKLTAETDINYKSTEGSAGDKFTSLFSGETPEEKVLEKFVDLSESEKDRYAQDLQDGKILLYAEGADTVSDDRTSDHDTNDMQWNNVYGNDERLTDSDRRDNMNTASGSNDEYIREENELDNRGMADSNLDNRNSNNMNDRNMDNMSDKEKMELHEEKLDVDKNRRQAGEVEVNKETVHDKQEFDVPVTHEEVTVERRPVNEVRDGESSFSNKDGAYEDNDSIHVPVHEEEVEVNKKDMVKEEIIVNKKEMKDNVHVEEDVRREEADISDSSTENFRNRKDDDNLNR